MFIHLTFTGYNTSERRAARQLADGVGRTRGAALLFLLATTVPSAGAPSPAAGKGDLGSRYLAAMSRRVTVSEGETTSVTVSEGEPGGGARFSRRTGVVRPPQDSSPPRTRTASAGRQALVSRPAISKRYAVPRESPANRTMVTDRADGNGMELYFVMAQYLSDFSRYMKESEAAGGKREFLEIGRLAGRFPAASSSLDGTSADISVWCSNDCLGMGQHPDLLTAIKKTIDEFGAGAGGSRNIGGTNHYHVLLEKELADLHGQEDALLLTSG